MLIKLREVLNPDGRPETRNIFLRKESVVFLVDAPGLTKLNESIHGLGPISKVTIITAANNNREIYVVGTALEIKQKLDSPNRKLLNG